MIQFSATRIFHAGRSLRFIKGDVLASCVATASGEAAGFAVHQELDTGGEVKTLAHLRAVEEIFREVGMDITADTTKEIREKIEKKPFRISVEWVLDHVGTIEDLAEKELRRRVFFYVPPERYKSLPETDNPHLFTDAVSNAFPGAVYDVSEAGMCLGLARPSACVFHLMRVLEVGLAALGRVFGISLAHTNWALAIEQLERKIREMHKDPDWKSLPDCKTQQEFYAQAASHFGILKDAWRNYTMHARGTYTEEQAERIFENTRDFMQKLAGRLHE
jgi:hypothetical protein